MIRIKKIRQGARMQRCTANIEDVCNHNPETTVCAHYGEPGEKGLGVKPDDSSVAYLCSDCHDVLDGRVSSRIDKQWYWFRAMRRTWKLLLDQEILK